MGFKAITKKIVDYIIGSSSTHRAMDVSVNVDSGDQSAHVRAVNAQVNINDPASSSGVFGADPRAGHFAVVYNSTTDGDEISGFQTNAILGQNAIGTTVDIVTGHRTQIGINSSSGTITEGYGQRVLTTNGTNNAAKQITTLYAFYADDNSPQTRVGVGKFFNFYAAGGISYFGGSFARKSKRLAVSGEATIDDCYIGVTDTSSARTVTIKSDAIAYAEGLEFIIKDESLAAGTNNITIATEGSETIEGGPTLTINTNGGFFHLKSDGTNLFIIG